MGWYGLLYSETTFPDRLISTTFWDCWLETKVLPLGKRTAEVGHCTDVFHTTFPSPSYSTTSLELKRGWRIWSLGKKSEQVGNHCCGLTRVVLSSLPLASKRMYCPWLVTMAMWPFLNLRLA